MKYFKGCMLEAFERGDVKIIANQVGCFTMGQGVSDCIKKKWPKHAESYKWHTEYWGSDNILGTSFDTYVPDKRCIYGLVTKDKCGCDAKQHINYAALISALLSCGFCRGDVIGMSCRDYEGDWLTVEQLLQDFEKVGGVEFWVYEGVVPE